MKKLLLSARLFTFAAALTAFGGSVSLAAAPEPVRPASPSPAAYCKQVKAPSARTVCFDSVKQMSSGNLLTAQVLMQKAVAAAPKEGVPRMLLGSILLQQDNAYAAERELRLARDNGAPDQAVLPILFRAMIARHANDQLLAEFPDPAPGAAGEVTARILHGRALALRSLGRLDEAAAAMDRSLLLFRGPDALRDRTEMAIRQHDSVLADRLIDESLRLDPKNGSALLAKLRQLESSGDAAKTLAFSEQILKTYPNNIDTKVVRINVFLKLKQDGRAKAEVNSILAGSPREPLGRYYQAVLLDRANDKNAAWQIVIALPPEFVKQHPEYALQMAQIAFDNGNVETGAGILGSAIGVAPDLLDVRLRLAEVRMSQKRPQSASVLMAPVKDSRDPRVQKMLTQIHGAIEKNRAF